MKKFTKSEIDNKLNDIENFYNKINLELQKYPKNMWKYKHNENKWSIHEIIIHIVEVQIYIFTILRTFLTQPEKHAPSWDEEIWTKKLNYHDENLEDWLNLFKMINNIMLNKLKKITLNDWIKEFPYEDKQLTLCDWLNYNNSHVEGHIIHMSEIYKLWLNQNS